MDTLEAKSSTSKQVLDPTDALKGLTPPGAPPDPPPGSDFLPEDTFKARFQSPTTTYRPRTFPTAPAGTTAKRTTTTTTASTTSKSFSLRHQPPFIVTRTASSTSVSASGRVHFETPFSRFSFRQGPDSARASALLPAPHLRPSLLKLAAAQGRTDYNLNASNRRVRGALPPFLLYRRPYRHRPRRSTKLYTKQPKRKTFKDFLLRQSFHKYFRKLLDGKTHELTNGHATTLSRWKTAQISDVLSHMASSSIDDKTEWNKELSYGIIWARKLADDQMFSSSFSCTNQNGAGVFADKDFGCRVFHICNGNDERSDESRMSYICSKKNEIFDESRRKCVSNDLTRCHYVEDSYRVTQKEQNSQQANIECHLLGLEVRIADLETNCRKYFGCESSVTGNVRMRTWMCPEGEAYSELNQKCLRASNVNCLEETIILTKLAYLHQMVESEAMLTDNFLKENAWKINMLRRKRSSFFMNRNSHREATSGSLTKASGLFSDHSSVIDSQSPGNVVDVRVILPQFNAKQKTNTNKPTAIPPPTSHAINKTLRNGTITEVSEITAPDQIGKVKITSIVPKLVRQNGNGGRVTKPNPTHSVNVASGQSKVRLSGSISSISGGGASKELVEMTTDNAKGSNESTDPSTNDSVGITEESDDILTTTILSIVDSPSTPSQSTEVTTQKAVTSTSTTTPSTTSTTTTASTTTLAPQVSTEAIPETNFTCRDRDLEKFYPDVEAVCKVFHYCAPGFSDDQVLDLKFLCTGDTIFDSVTSTCQDMEHVTCGTTSVSPPMTTTPIPMTSASTSVSSTTTAVRTTAVPTIPVTSTEVPTEVLRDETVITELTPEAYSIDLMDLSDTTLENDPTYTQSIEVSSTTFYEESSLLSEVGTSDVTPAYLTTEQVYSDTTST